MMNRKRGIAVGTHEPRVLWKTQDDRYQSELFIELDRLSDVGRRDRYLIELHEAILLNSWDLSEETVDLEAGTYVCARRCYERERMRARGLVCARKPIHC